MWEAIPLPTFYKVNIMSIKLNDKYNMLTLISMETTKVGSNRHRLFRCDCGTEKWIRTSHVTGGRTESCGCLNRKNKLKHGMYNTREYTSWECMKGRCQNPNNSGYKDYGGRGITVCERWQDFVNFYEDMGSRPQNTTLGRIDNEKGYYPENVRWETNEQQSTNKRPRKDRKFNSKDIEILISLRESGKSYSKIAKLYDCSIATIFKYVNNR